LHPKERKQHAPTSTPWALCQIQIRFATLAKPLSLPCSFSPNPARLPPPRRRPPARAHSRRVTPTATRSHGTAARREEGRRPRRGRVLLAVPRHREGSRAAGGPRLPRSPARRAPMLPGHHQAPVPAQPGRHLYQGGGH